MKKGKLLGKGMTAEVYEWGNDKVLKLYFKSFSDEWIENEINNVTKVNEAGLSAPEVVEILNIEGRKGVVFKRIFGKSISKCVEIEPWRIFCFVQQMAHMQFNIHKHSSNSLLTQKEKLRIAIEKSTNLLGKNKKNEILDYLANLPDGNSICHGDLHFGNVIVSEKGLIAVDWTNAYQGNPLGDVARTSLIISYPVVQFEPFINIITPYTLAANLLHQAYINEYMKLTNVKFEEIDNWILPIAAAKLKEKIPGEKKWLMNIIDKRC